MAIGVTAAVVGTIGVVAMTTASAASSGRVTSAANGKCLDVTNGSTADGNQPQMWTCYTGSANQNWTFADNGSVQGLGKCLDVANGSTADGAVVHLWTCYDTVASQKWQLTAAGDLVNTNAGKCLDIKDNNLADGAKLQLWSCAGTANQKWTFSGGSTNPTPTTVPPNGGNPDLGPNVSVFDPSMSQATIQSRLNTVFNQQVSNQFGNARFALLFKPGTYNVNANVGFFTQVAGLGLSPDSVVINGAVHAEADWWPDGSQNATQNFWRSAENLSVTPTGGLDRWAVSQAAPYRRMHVRGNLALSDGGWSSGGWISDSKIDGQIQSGTQQQWITRNSQIGSWTGQNWNQVFVGVQGAPGTSFPNPPYTNVGNTPVVREKPFLYVDNAGAYQVFVPSLRSNTSGTSWSSGTTAGSSLPISQFYIVKSGATAASINAALAAGQNLLFTPGVYNVSDTIRITRPDTVVLGLGLAT
ncbi:ricin-type beta-trefoil lectin domain protein, partial [Dactylosporangium siamense]